MSRHETSTRTNKIWTLSSRGQYRQSGRHVLDRNCSHENGIWKEDGTPVLPPQQETVQGSPACLWAC
eukprot:653609-Pelagomonas_calceolata.AAC.5